MDFTKSKIAIAVATAATLTGCGGGGGGGGGPQTRPSPVYGWSNGIYTDWTLSQSGVATADTTDDPLCTADVYTRDVYWEQTIDGERTGVRGDFIRTESEERNVSCPTPLTAIRTEDTNTTTSSSSNGTPTVSSTYMDTTTTSTDSSGNTITEVWRTYTDTTTTPVTTTTTTITTRTTYYSNNTSSSEVINTQTTQETSNVTSSSTRESELVSRTVTANLISSTLSSADETTTTNGTPTSVTTYTDETRTSTDANGSTVTEVWRVYTITVTTPVTTTVTTTTTRTTTYTDGTTSAEVIDVSSTSNTSNTVSTSTREELLSQTVTPNVASVDDSTSAESTTTTGSPVLDNTIVNTDTREDGVWYFYYDNWTVTTTTVTTTTTTRTTTYTDGTTATEVVGVVTDTVVDNVDTYTTIRYTSPDKPLLSDPLPPDDIDGSAVIGTWTGEGRTLDYDPGTYNASTYYNSPYIGTPTAVESHDPADFATLEADNGQLLETRANYAYARGWTGLGSTVLILDTGIDTDHPELADKIKYQWEPGYDTGLEDTNGHGTHVAGIVAAAKDGTGMHGIAYDAELAVARIGERSPSMSFARDALTWAKQYDDIVAANISANVVYSTDYKNSIVDQGNGIYTNTHATYGGANYYNSEDPADWSTALSNSEIVLTVSAGNSGLDYVQNPATFASAVDADGNLLLDGRMLVVGNWNTGTGLVEGNKAGHVCKDYTTQCNDPYLTKDFYILAPGMRVYSTYLNGEYKNLSGTSMAAPAVAGAVAIVHQLWPYMKGANIAQLLLQTADKDLPNYDENTHGQGLLDLDTATRPVGDLGISLTGRTGTTVELSGTISVNGINAAELSNISAVDDYDRDFTVDLSSANVERKISVEYADRQKNNGGWASTMANLTARNVDGVRFAASENVEEYSVGYEHRFFDTNLTVGVSYTKADTNPWIDMSGMWGEVNGSQTTELNLTYDYKDMWAQVGAMNTNTRYKTGLVTDVDDIQSVYATVGYDADAIAVFGGIKPYAVNGSVTMRLPTSVDADGVMHYDTVSSRVRSELDGYVGFKHSYNKKNHGTTFVGIVDGGGEGHLNFNYRYKF